MVDGMQLIVVRGITCRAPGIPVLKHSELVPIGCSRLIGEPVQAWTIYLSERLWVVGNSVSPAYFAESRDVPLLQMPIPIFLSEGILLPPQVIDQMALYLKDVSQEIFLPSGGKVAADEGWAVAVWVNAHPLELLVAGSAVLRLDDLELPQRGIQGGIAVDSLLNLHLYYYYL